MSDYEHEDWEARELAPAYPINVPTQAFKVPIGPKSAQLRADATSPSYQPRVRNPQLAATFEPNIQAIVPVTHADTTDGRDQPVEDENILLISSDSYRRSHLLPTLSDATFELQQAWQQVSESFQNSRRTKQNAASEYLTRIHAESGAYVKPHGPWSKQLGIWGTNEQCQKAMSMLNVWETELQCSPSKSKQEKWFKPLVQDGRREHREMESLFNKYARPDLAALEDHAFSFEAYLVWPPEYDFDAFLKLYELNTLRDISDNFNCRWQHEKQAGVRFTKLQAQSEANLLAAYQRLTGLIKEMICLQSQGLRANLFLLPTFESYKQSLVVRRHISGNSCYIELVGEPHDKEMAGNWALLVRKMESKARKALRESLESFVKTFHGHRKFMRLRVEFGDLALKTFPKMKAGTDCYPTHEFLQLTQQPRTQFSDCELQAWQGDIGDLYDTLMTVKDLSLSEETFEVFYDFKKKENSNEVRLEIELIRGLDQRDVEIRAQRWLSKATTTGYNNDVLGIKILDLENPSFMIRATSFDLVKENAISQEMSDFQRKHSFTPSQPIFTCPPYRRARFPFGRDDLHSVTERTCAKFSLVGTEGILELSRADVYRREDGKDSFHCASSKWTLSYYYLNWDNLLDEFATLSAGEDVSWQRKVSTFFPRRDFGDGPDSMCGGFKNFWKELRRVQELTKNTLLRLPGVESASKQFEKD